MLEAKYWRYNWEYVVEIKTINHTHVITTTGAKVEVFMNEIINQHPFPTIVSLDSSTTILPVTTIEYITTNKTL